MDRIHIPSNLPVTADLVRRLEEEVTTLRARLQAVEGERDDPAFMYAGTRIRRQAIEARNREIDQLLTRAQQAEQRVAGLEAALREMLSLFIDPTKINDMPEGARIGLTFGGPTLAELRQWRAALASATPEGPRE